MPLFAPKDLRSRWDMCLQQLKTCHNASLRVLRKDDTCLRWFIAKPHHSPYFICNPACPLEDPDNLALVISNRELIEGPHTAAANDDNVRRADVDDIATFIAEPCEYSHIRLRNAGRFRSHYPHGPERPHD